MEYTSQRHEGISFVCLNMTKSQPGDSKRTCDREPLFHTGVGGHLSGVISLFLRMLRYQENTKFKKKKLQYMVGGKASFVTFEVGGYR